MAEQRIENADRAAGLLTLAERCESRVAMRHQLFNGDRMLFVDAHGKRRIAAEDIVVALITG